MCVPCSHHRACMSTCQALRERPGPCGNEMLVGRSQDMNIFNPGGRDNAPVILYRLFVDRQSAQMEPSSCVRPL